MLINLIHLKLDQEDLMVPGSIPGFGKALRVCMRIHLAHAVSLDFLKGTQQLARPYSCSFDSM